MGQKCRKYRRDRKNKLIDPPARKERGKACSTKAFSKIKNDDKSAKDTNKA